MPVSGRLQPGGEVFGLRRREERLDHEGAKADENAKREERLDHEGAKADENAKREKRENYSWVSWPYPARGVAFTARAH